MVVNEKSSINNDGSIDFLAAVTYFIATEDFTSLGKLFAKPGEDYTKLKIEEMKDFKCTPNKEKNNGPSYDLVVEYLIQLMSILTVNAKFRAKDFHLSNTRRTTGINAGCSDSGHVPYKIGECDLFAFVVPQKHLPPGRPYAFNEYDYLNTNNWRIVLIPEYELHDPKKPGYLKTGVGRRIVDKYTPMSAKEVLLACFQRKIHRK